VKASYKAIILLLLVLLALPAWAKYPQRIISGMPSITEMLFALDLGDRVVGVTSNCNYPPEAKKKEKVGGFFLNLEKTVSLKPDLIVMLEDAQKRDIEKFKNYGLPVCTINPHNLNDVLESMIKLGEVAGKKKKAEILVSEMKKRISAVKPKSFGLNIILKRPRVLAVVGYNPLIVVGGGTFIDDIIEHAGGMNIAREAKAAYPQFSFEKLMQENPDFIIAPEGVISSAEIQKDGRWRRLAAVKNNRILFIDADILSRPGPRVVDAIEEIAKFINDKKT